MGEASAGRPCQEWKAEGLPYLRTQPLPSSGAHCNPLLSLPAETFPAPHPAVRAVLKAWALPGLHGSTL